MHIGVLALQGGFDAHVDMLTRCGSQACLVKTAAQLDDIDGLIIPGGESSTLLNLIEKQQLSGPLEAFFLARKPIFGTCAGMILMASEVTCPAQPAFSWMDIAVKRNAYGRQADSVITTTSDFTFETDDTRALELVFIRAPAVSHILNDTVTTLATYNKTPVMLRQNHCLVTSFHPELGDDLRVHRYFIDMVFKSR